MVEVTTEMQQRMDQARALAVASGCSLEAIEAVAPIYERFYADSIERIEYRVALEVWTAHGWSVYHQVPLGSHEVEALPAIRALAAARVRPEAPLLGDFGMSWVEARTASRWQPLDTVPQVTYTGDVPVRGSARKRGAGQAPGAESPDRGHS